MRSEIIKYPYLSCVVTHCMYILGNADSSLEPKLIYNDKLMVLNKTHSSAYRHIYDDDRFEDYDDYIDYDDYYDYNVDSDYKERFVIVEEDELEPLWW